MRRPVLFVVAVCCALLVGAVAVRAQGPRPQGVQTALGTAFTYQGQLKQNGAPVTSSCNLSFKLYSDAGGTSLVAGPVTGSPNPVTVTGGLFTVRIDFGANAFTGEARWLQTIVQCASDSSPTTLSLQPLTPAPYALHAADAWSVNGNTGTSAGNFIGTTDNVSFTIRVSNTVAYRIVPASNPTNGFAPNINGGSDTNSIAPGLVGATIAGGGSTQFPNVVKGFGVYATIGGGSDNTASSAGATIGGGLTNMASAPSSTIGGGANNTDTVSAIAATIGGGALNIVSGTDSTVGGGYANNASGYRATVPGGDSNAAQGDYSFAAGRRAKANHAGAFVWADSTDADFASTANDQFLIRATGGVGIGTTHPLALVQVVTANETGTGTTPSWDARHFVVGGAGITGGLGLSYDQVNNVGYIEALSPSTAWRNLVLQAGGGSVGIGTNTFPAKLTVAGDIRVGTSGTNGCVQGFDGTALAGSCSSDVRLKTDITPFPSVLAQVVQLQPVHFQWRADEFPEYHFGAGTTSAGLLAQDVERVFPDLVGTDAHGFETVDYSALPMLLLQGLKDLRAEKDIEVGALKAQNEQQQRAIQALREQIAAMQSQRSAETYSRAVSSIASPSDAILPALVGLSLLMNGVLGAVLLVHLRRGGRA